MINSFINPVINPDAALGVGSFDDSAPSRLWQNSSEAEVEIVIRAVYRQVLGNAHLMESERLVVAESQLKRGEISVREFVRHVAQSDLYRDRFFEPCSRMRSIELNFKHLLGRAPESYEEMVEHGQWLDQSGFEAEIDSYLDSDEYQTAFGEDIVPYYRGYRTQPGKNMAGFTHLFQLLRGAASSDKDLTRQNRARLNAALMSNRPSPIAPVKGAPSAWQTNVLEMPSSPTAATAAQPAVQAGSTGGAADWAAQSALQQTVQAQAQQITALQRQLADLSPFAAIGSAQLKNDWQPAAVADPVERSTSLQRQADAQTAQIELLQAQIVDARRYAAIGEARLNKWRSRVFNG